MSWLLALLRAPFYVLAAIVIVIEDFAWDPLQRAAAWVGQLPVFKQLERAIAGLPPYGALACFLTPSIIILPAKLLALAALARGMVATGIIIAIAAKVVGTALVSRIFTLCKPTLLSVPWFARAHGWVTRFKERLRLFVTSNSVYRAVKRISVTIRAWFAAE